MHQLLATIADNATKRDLSLFRISSVGACDMYQDKPSICRIVDSIYDKYDDIIHNAFNEEEPTTNYEVIRNMNPEEMAVMHRMTNGCKNCPAYPMCKDDISTKGSVDITDCQMRYE